MECSRYCQNIEEKVCTGFRSPTGECLSTVGVITIRQKNVHPSLADKAVAVPLESAAHVLSRQDWYCSPELERIVSNDCLTVFGSVASAVTCTFNVCRARTGTYAHCM